MMTVKLNGCCVYQLFEHSEFPILYHSVNSRSIQSLFPKEHYLVDFCDGCVVFCMT